MLLKSVFAFLVLSCIAVVHEALYQQANPLATTDQRQLDALATELSQDHGFHFLRSVAKATWISTLKFYGKNVDDQIRADVDAAMDELVFSCIQKAVNNDPVYPKVYWTDAPPRNNRWFGLMVPGGRYSYDNPDCIYRTIPISHKYEYRVHGRRGINSPSDVTFSLISNPNSQNTIAALSGRDLVVDANGNFTITINSRNSASKNHIQSNDKAVQLLIRDNLGDWSSETPNELSVEIIVEVNVAPVSNKTIISQARANLAESIFFYGFGALNLKTLLLQPVNTVRSPTQSQTLGTLTTQASSFAHFNLADDESLVITLTQGNSSYWVVPITTFGLISTTPGDSVVSFNNRQASPNDNGTYSLVVCKNDPGVFNWLNTTGRSQGTIMARWQGLPAVDSEDNGIEVFSSVVKLQDLRNFLPLETKYVNAAERQIQLQERIRGYDRIHWQ